MLFAWVKYLSGTTNTCKFFYASLISKTFDASLFDVHVVTINDSTIICFELYCKIHVFTKVDLKSKQTSGELTVIRN